MSIGLKRGAVSLEPHSAAWEEHAKETISVLEHILGSDAVDIQHVGSTAIVSIMAKPIIDIAVAVKAFPDFLQHEEALEAAGIVFRGEDVAGQMLFVIGDFEKDTRSDHIHVVRWNDPNWMNYLNFRDYLKANPSAAWEYSARKEKLAKKHPNDRAAYTKGIREMIHKLLVQAAVWRKECLAASGPPF